MTTTTDNINSSPNSKPIIMYYDDACVICSSEASNMKARNPKGITLTSVDEGIDVLNKAGFSREDAMTYLCVQDSTGNWHKGMDGIRLLYKTAGVPFAKVLYLPVIKQMSNITYPVIAKNRYRFPNWLSKLLYGKEVVDACKDGVCKLPPAKR